MINYSLFARKKTSGAPVCVSSVALFISKRPLQSWQSEGKEEEKQLNRDPEFTSRRKKASVPKALLILAQISIACKELLTSLKQAILIKARIINSDLRTTWALKVEERFRSKRSKKLEAGGGRKIRVRVWAVPNKLQNCQEFSKGCQVHRAVPFGFGGARFSRTDVSSFFIKQKLHLWITPPALPRRRLFFFLV